MKWVPGRAWKQPHALRHRQTPRKGGPPRGPRPLLLPLLLLLLHLLLRPLLARYGFTWTREGEGTTREEAAVEPGLRWGGVEGDLGREE